MIHDKWFVSNTHADTMGLGMPLVPHTMQALFKISVTKSNYKTPRINTPWVDSGGLVDQRKFEARQRNIFDDLVVGLPCEANHICRQYR